MPLLERSKLYKDVWSRLYMKWRRAWCRDTDEAIRGRGSARNLDRVMGRPLGSLPAKPLPDGKIPADQTIRLEAIDDRIQFHPSSPP
jgi:hypothetical protein